MIRAFRTTAAALLLVLTFAPISALAQLPDVLVVTAELSGKEVRPGPGVPTGFALVALHLLGDSDGMVYKIMIEGLGNVTTIDIHRGSKGVVGPPVVQLKPNFDGNGYAVGSLRATRELLEEMRNNPSGFYIDVHTQGSPGGALRSQLQSTMGRMVQPAGPMTGANIAGKAGDPDGLGFGIFRITGDGRVEYTLVTQKVGTPTAAHIHYGGPGQNGKVMVDLKPTVTNGVATGAVDTRDVIVGHQMIAFPGDFYIDVHTTEFPDGALRAQLGQRTRLTELVVPAAGSAAGANDTFFRTDLSIVNQTNAVNPVLIEYYASGENASASPTATAHLMLAPHEQRNFQGDALQTLLGGVTGTGAIRIESPGPVRATARVYNDQRAAGKGTFSQFVSAQPADAARGAGALPMLANQQATSGYRTNIGWFNASGGNAAVTFNAHRSDGTVVQTTTRNVPAGQQLQLGLQQLFPALDTSENVYVTFESTFPLFVYASIVDNVNGDAMFMPAQEP